MRRHLTPKMLLAGLASVLALTISALVWWRDDLGPTSLPEAQAAACPEELTDAQVDRTELFPLCDLGELTPLMRDVDEYGLFRYGEEVDCPAFANLHELVIVTTPTSVADADALSQRAVTAIEAAFADTVVDLRKIVVSDDADGTAFVATLDDPLDGLGNPGLFDALEAAQGLHYSVDLNYLVALQPNNGHAPGDDPEPVETAPLPPDVPSVVADIVAVDSPQADEALVQGVPTQEMGYPTVWDDAVGAGTIRFPQSEPTADYDTDSDDIADHNQGHGPFVAYMLASRAPGATVTLATTREDVGKDEEARALMTFEESDLIASLHAGTGFAVGLGGDYSVSPADIVNLSLGASVCGLGDAHRALVREMGNLLYADGGMSRSAGEAAAPGDFGLMFVAAAGNVANTKPFTPAYFGEPGLPGRIVEGVEWPQEDDPETPEDDTQAEAEMTHMAELVEAHTVAVGALDTNGTSMACYSNRGWVDVWAPGTDQVSVFAPELTVDAHRLRAGREGRSDDDPGSDAYREPITTPWASWSGTSFATPRVSAAIAGLMTTTGSSAHQAWRSFYQGSAAVQTAESQQVIDASGLLIAPDLTSAPPCE